MPLYRPSELRTFLDAIGQRPKRTLSQNFLVDGNIVAKIVSEAQLGDDAMVIEIGPGPGVLTEAFLSAGVRVAAIEKDTAFAQALPRLDPQGTRLTVVNADIIDYPLETLTGSYPPAQVVVVSNLPYHLTTPIIKKLIDHRALFSRAVLMVQEEAARRLTGGKPGCIGRLVELFSEVRYAFHVPKGCFYPQPNVDSAVLTLQLRQLNLSPQEQQLAVALIHHSFAHRRKTALHSLLQHYPRQQLIRAFDAIGLAHGARPEEISADRWMQLSQALTTA